MASDTNNNVGNQLDRNREPTLNDIVNILANIPNKTDFSTMQDTLMALTKENTTKIKAVERKIESVSSDVATNSDKIAGLESTIQALQQDKLRNNVCISGLPIDDHTNISDSVVKIANTLQITIRPIDFTAYAAANNKFVIVAFNNYVHKQMLINKIRIKKSLMVEEVFGAARSNSQIYINEHLTKYFNKIYLTARVAKKQGKLAAVLTSGGKIRVRKHANDAPVIISDESQLQLLIEEDMEETNQNNEQLQAGTSTEERTHRLTRGNSNNQVTERHRGRPSKRKAFSPSSAKGPTNPNKKNKN